MVRWFPHEVSDFEFVLSTLQQQDPHDHEVSSHPSLPVTSITSFLSHADMGNSLHSSSVADVPSLDTL